MKFHVAGGQCITRIAYDWIGANIYYTDKGANRIGLCHVANQLCTVLIQDPAILSQPGGIAVHPKIGQFFWVNINFSMSASVYRAAMDGSNPIKVRDTGAGFPNGITVDFENSRLYWADHVLGTLETCTLDGTDHYVITNLRNARPAGIDIKGDYLYWGEITGNRIWSITKNFGCQTSSSALLYDEGDQIHDLKVYDGSKQPLDRENPCVWAMCSHLCALSGEASTTCLCPEGLELGLDGKICHDI